MASMKTIQIIRYLWPLIQLLIKILLPKIIDGLEDIHDNVELYTLANSLGLNKSERNLKKVELFDQQAYELFNENKINLAESEINLVREIIHNICEFKAQNNREKA